MIKNSFDKEYQIIKKTFKKPLKDFTNTWKTEPSLLDFYQVYDNKFAELILEYCNSFIYFNSLKTQQEFDNKIFKNPDYYNLLKSIALLVLASQNNYTKNIFKENLKGYKNPYELQIDERLDLEIQEAIKVSSNTIYTTAYYLAETLNLKNQIEIIYNCIFNYVVFCLTRTSTPILTKKFLFWSKEKIDWEKYSLQYEIQLEYYKNIQINLRQLLPIYFNNIIYIINNDNPKLK